MALMIQTIPLQLENPFHLSYGTTTVRENVVIELSGAPGGYGEAAVVPYTGETAARVIRYLEDPAVAEAVRRDPLLLEDALDALPFGESSAARAAVDIALHDRWGRALGQPLYRLWGLNPTRCPQSSFTVAIADDEADYREHIRAAGAFDLIKLKLGSGDWRRDLDLVDLARDTVSSRFAWTPTAAGPRKTPRRSSPYWPTGIFCSWSSPSRATTLRAGKRCVRRCPPGCRR